MAILRELRLNDELRIEDIRIFVRRIAPGGKSVRLVMECPEDIPVVHIPYGASRWKGKCKCGEEVTYEGDPGNRYVVPCVSCDREIKLFPQKVKKDQQGGAK